MTVLDSVLWRRLDTPGSDFCALLRSRSGYRVVGTSNFVHEARSCSLQYDVECRSTWETRTATVRGYVGRRHVDMHIRRDSAGAWTLNGRLQPLVSGCTDIDLSFTP